MSPDENYDVVVIGAGVVGAMIARELSRYELKILVLEAESDLAMGATKANSGIVHGGYAESRHELKGRLAAEGRRMFTKLETELNFGFRVTGSLVVSFDDDLAPLEKLKHQGLENGLSDLRIIKQDELRGREPHISKNAKAALFCEGAGVCSPWDLAIAAMENAIHNGAELRLNTRVIGAVRENNSNLPVWILDCLDSSVETSTGQSAANITIKSNYVINAAGLYAGELEALAGLGKFNISPRTGQYLLFGANSGSLVNSVLFGLPGVLGKGILVGPTYQNNLIIGPDAQNNFFDDTESTLRSTSVERLRNIVAQARSLVDGIDLKLAIRSFAGIRAASVSGDFDIGFSGQSQQSASQKCSSQHWYRVAGIQSPGLTASPAIAKMLIGDLAADGLGLVEKRHFDPYRPPLSTHLSKRHRPIPFAEVNELAKLPAGNPERVVCRCEQVREKDLLEAREHGLPMLSIDAVKRRTRAGMGWCQGQFCRPRVAEWLGAISASEDWSVFGASRVEAKELRNLDSTRSQTGQNEHGQ